MLAIVAGYEEMARLLADAGGRSFRQAKGSGAPGFAGKTAFHRD